MTARQYCKRPVVVDAFHYEGTLASSYAVLAWITANGGRASLVDGYASQGPDTLAISTLEGTMTALPGDYIIRGVQGEFYPCKPDIFASTYEEVSE